MMNSNTKDAVLAILRGEQGFLSGEKISVSLGVSRAAVHAAVKSLRAEGYEILSATNKGYRLHSVPDLLNTSALSAWLPSQRMESVLCLDEVDSTNSRLRALAYDGAPDGQIVVANGQSEGRGRQGRAFASPKDRGIYLSLLLRPSSTPAEVIEITAWTAVAVNNALENVYGVRAGIKWVNDLVMNRKKLCGILSEMIAEPESGHVEFLVVGIGVNVSERISDFPPELRPIAGSIFTETGKLRPRAQMTAAIIRELDRMRADWPRARRRYLDAYRSDDITVGREIRVVSGGKEIPGVAERINDDFSLTIRRGSGALENISGGEVSIRGLYGS